jgi:phosphate transport system substrate-binding protein
MNGSLKAEGKSPALAVFVSRNNPLRQITIAQLATILGCPSDPKQPITWAIAGAEGVWKTKPIHAFLYDDQTGTGAFLQQAIQGTKDCWNWDIVREFKDITRPNGSIYPAAQQIADALKHDPNGLAISALTYTSPALKPLRLAASGHAIPLTPETITAATYPLRRPVYVYINRAQDKPVDPKVKEFLSFILSPEGQSLIHTEGDFLPLNPALAHEQLSKLE